MNGLIQCPQIQFCGGKTIEPVVTARLCNWQTKLLFVVMVVVVVVVVVCHFHPHSLILIIKP